jgi:uncharacterized membrane protein
MEAGGTRCQRKQGATRQDPGWIILSMAGVLGSAPLAINSPAKAADFTPGQHGFLYSGGKITQIDVPGASSTGASGINGAGQIVGETSVGSATGDPHFTTYDGVHYDYQGIGDFLLARSTVPGDQFDVQVRTKSWNTWTSVMSEAAVTLCNHNVTFDVDPPVPEGASSGSTVPRLR